MDKERGPSPTVPAVYRKAHLWDAEKKVFTPGDDAPPVVELPFGNVGLMICYDLEFPEWVRLAALRGADLIAAPVNWSASASPAPSGERAREVVSTQGAAWANAMYIAVADRCKAERGADWVGGSVIIGHGGYPAAGPLCADRPVVLSAAIDLRLARDKRVSERNDLFADRRPDLYARPWDHAWPACPCQMTLAIKSYTIQAIALQILHDTSYSLVQPTERPRVSPIDGIESYVEEFAIWSPPFDTQAARRALTKVDVAYQLLRDEIFQGTLSPGTSLDQEAIAARLGLSTTPVREALRRLESEKLVISRSHRDTIVAPVSLELLESTYQVRLSLDPLAVGLAALNASDEQLAAIERLCAPPTYDDPVADLHSNRTMHRAIYAACGNATLVEILDLLWDKSDRYRLIVLRTESTAMSAHQEHEAIVRAVLARDPERSAELMREHIATSPGHIKRQATEESD